MKTTIGVNDKNIYLYLIAMSFVFMFPHSMAFWGNGNYPTDVCVYYRCAEWINQGLIMYKDMFDHKGPLVYLIYLGVTRGVGLYGVWLMDIIIAFGLFAVCYKISRLYTDAKKSLIICSIIGLYLNLPYTDEGGSEWIAMLGCAYTSYLLAKHLKDNIYCSFCEVFCLSVAVAVCLLTKANTSAGIIPVAIFIAYHLFCRFNMRVFIGYACAVILGLATVCCPVLLWMHNQGNMSDFINSYLIFNIHDYGSLNTHDKWMGLVNITLVCLPGFLFYAVFVFCNLKSHKTLFWISLLFIFSITFNAFVKNGYPHYIFPCMGVFTVLLANSWEKICHHNVIHHGLLILLLIVGIITYWVRCYLRIEPFDTYHDREVATILNEHRGDSEYVMVYGLEDRTMWEVNDPAYSFHYRIWLLLEGKPASKYFYIPAGLPSEVREESLETISNRCPRCILAHKQNSNDILNLGYTIYSTDEKGYQILLRNENIITK